MCESVSKRKLVVAEDDEKEDNTWYSCKLVILVVITAVLQFKLCWMDVYNAVYVNIFVDQAMYQTNQK